MYSKNHIFSVEYIRGSCMFNDLKLIIDFILINYQKVCTVWDNQCQSTYFINLKSKTVKNINEDSKIIEYIFNYLQFILSVSIDMDLEQLDFEKSTIRTRIKTQNSIATKIKIYSDDKHFFGQIPIKKCLNDLFGFRIIIDDIFSFIDIKKYIDDNYSELKCIDSSKNGYCATHIYFSKNGYNQFFPWELQIWQKCNEQSNLESHKRYKQSYTDWEHLVKEE